MTRSKASLTFDKERLTVDKEQEQLTVDKRQLTVDKEQEQLTVDKEQLTVDKECMPDRSKAKQASHTHSNPTNRTNSTSNFVSSVTWRLPWTTCLQ